MLKRFENLGTALSRNETKNVVGGGSATWVKTGWTLTSTGCLCDYQTKAVFLINDEPYNGVVNRCNVPCAISECK